MSPSASTSGGGSSGSGYGDHTQKQQQGQGQQQEGQPEPQASASAAAAGAPQWEPSSEQIPRALLTARDPILLYDELPLYESELDDHGSSRVTVKVRGVLLWQGCTWERPLKVLLPACGWCCTGESSTPATWEPAEVGQAAVQATPATACMLISILSALPRPALCSSASCPAAGMCCCASGCGWTTSCCA